MGGRDASRRRHHSRPLALGQLLPRLQTNCLSVVDWEEVSGLILCQAASAGWKEGNLFVALLFLLSVVLLLFFLFLACSPSWRPLPSLKRERYAAAAILLSGDNAFLHLVLTGGTDGSSALSDVSLLSLGVDGDAPRWIQLAPMHHARFQHGIALFAKRILVVSGWARDSEAGQSVEMLRPPRAVGDPGQWTDLNPISGAADPELLPEFVHLAVHQNRLFSFGMS